MTESTHKPAVSKRTYEVALKAMTWFIILEQIRKQATDEDDFRLTESIRQHGILQPLGARWDGKLVWGERRFRCAIAAGMTEMPVVILDKDMTEGEYLTLQMQENLQRVDISPFDLFEGCVHLLQVNGWEQKDLARQLKMSASQASKILSVRKLTDEWREALKAGKVTISQCYEASSLPHESQNGRLYHLLQGKSEAQPVPAVHRPTTKLDRVKLVIAGCTLTLAGNDLDTEAVLKHLTAIREEVQRALKTGVTIDSLARVLADKAGAKS